MGRELPIIQFEDRPGILDLSWGHPAPGLLPVEEWLDAVREATATYGFQTLAYGADPGPGPLREWIASRLSEVDAASEPTEIFVTGGASHALSLTTTVLAEPGDVAIVDSPTYHLAFPTLRDHGVELVGAPTDDDGIDVDALNVLIDALRRQGRRVPMLYLVPTFGNPTGRSLPDDRRRALVDLALRSGMTIVEDDTYRELVYDGVAPTSLWGIAGTAMGRAHSSTMEPVIRLGSFAKSVAAGLRLGWIQASPAFVARVASLGYVHSGGGVNHAAAVAMATFGLSNAYSRHLSMIREQYALRRDALVNALSVGLNDVPAPAGGWFVWLRLPSGVRANLLVAVAERQGVSFLPGTEFYVDGRGDDRVRLSFSMLAPDELTEAGNRLVSAIRQADRAASGAS
ncbi:MAG TPA: PLP-dependent aminotransferase family protein [Micromonosporaceae bacterium]